MAYTEAYRVEFDNRRGQQCVVTIGKKNYAGETVSLMGAAVPFETQEEDDDNAFQTLRGQTGYVRIITADTDFIDKIMPASALDELVSLYVDGCLCWRGFVQAEVYAQEWRGGLREVEIPVASLVASLEHTALPASFRLGRRSIDSIVRTLIDQFECGAEQKNLIRDGFAQLFVNTSLFFQNSSEEGDTPSDDGASILNVLLEPFGVVVRDEDGMVCLCQYVADAKYHAYKDDRYNNGTPIEAPAQIDEMQFYAGTDYNPHADSQNKTALTLLAQDADGWAVPLTERNIGPWQSDTRRDYSRISYPFGLHIDVETEEESVSLQGFGTTNLLARMREQTEKETEADQWQDCPQSMLADALPQYAPTVRLYVDFLDVETGEEVEGEILKYETFAPEDITDGLIVLRRIYAKTVFANLDANGWRSYGEQTFSENDNIHIVRVDETSQTDDEGEYFTARLCEGFTTKIRQGRPAAILEWTALDGFEAELNRSFSAAQDKVAYDGTLAFVLEDATDTIDFTVYRPAISHGSITWTALQTPDGDTIMTLDQGMNSRRHTAYESFRTHLYAFRCTSLNPITVSLSGKKATLSLSQQTIVLRLTATASELKSFFNEEEEKSYIFAVEHSLIEGSYSERTCGWDSGDVTLRTDRLWSTGFVYLHQNIAATLRRADFSENEDGTYSCSIYLNVQAGSNTAVYNTPPASFWPVLIVGLPFGECELLSDIQMSLADTEITQDFEAVLLRTAEGQYFIEIPGTPPTEKQFPANTPFHLYELGGSGTATFYQTPYTYRLQGVDRKDFVREWRSADHTESRIRPFKYITIKAGLEKYDNETLITLPTVEEDDRQVFTDVLCEGTFNVQPHGVTQAEYNGRSNSDQYEFFFSLMRANFNGGPNDSNRFRQITYISNQAPETIINEAMWRKAGWEHMVHRPEHYTYWYYIYFYIGAYLCRWSLEGYNRDDSISTTSGVMLMMMESHKEDFPYVWVPVMTLHGKEQEFNEGLFCLNFNMFYVNEGTFDVGWSEQEHRIKFEDIGGLSFKVCIAVRYNNLTYFYNGTEWVQETSFVDIDFNELNDGRGIKSNSGKYPNAASNQGYYFPAHPGTLQITFSAAYTRKNHTDYWCSSMLRHFYISGLTVKYEASVEKSLFLSDRSENTYSATTAAKEYQERKTVETKIASFNNNRDSPSLLLNSSTQKDYVRWHFEETLLDRLRLYYSKIRNVYDVDIEKRPEYSTVFSVVKERNRTFLPIVANNNWRECEQRIKLIEVFDS